MVTSRFHRIAGLVAGVVAGGLGAIALNASAAADAAADPAPIRDAARTQAPASAALDPERPQGLASMSSPYVPGVPHVPADALLVLGPGGSVEGARFVGPDGSLFNGPVDEVDARVGAWWAEQLAAGLTPEEADALLAGRSS